MFKYLHDVARNSSIINGREFVYECISLTSVDCMQHFDLRYSILLVDNSLCLIFRLQVDIKLCKPLGDIHTIFFAYFDRYHFFYTYKY